MNKTAQRALRATAAFAGLATTFGFTGTALAATPAGEHLQQAPGHTALSDAGAATAGMSAPTAAPSADDMHSFALPRSVKADHDSDGDSDGGGPEHQSSADKYQDDDSPGYATKRSSNKELKHSNANREYGQAQCHGRNSAAVESYGFNGNKDADDPDSDGYNPDCDGYHADKGSNRYDDDAYTGTDSSRRHDEDFQFGKFL